MNKKRAPSAGKLAPKHFPHSPNFLKRFDITVGLIEAQRRFVHRISNQVFDSFFEHDIDDQTLRAQVLWRVADDLGDSYDWYGSLDSHVRSDFVRCLQVLESSYEALPTKKLKMELSNLVSYVISKSEIDLGIQWRNGVFIRKGAPLLDEGLINKNLDWLSQPQYSNVYSPFEKALSHFLRMNRDPKLGADVITDMYEALESLAKIITQRPDNDLSSNAQLFLSRVKASDEYKLILKSYIKYANGFRHGLGSRTKRSNLSVSEVESFIYLTGLFIRLAAQE